jgi:hypothetical protein
MDFTNHRLRLAETITWCLGQSLESMPSESDEVQRRRNLIAQANELMQKAHRAFKNDDINKMFKTREYREAARLLKEADPASIEPLKDQLRTISLRPFSMFDRPQTFSERIEIVEDVANRRAGLLKTMGRYHEVLQANLAQGRILLYAPDENLFDGAAQYSSKGFFDVNNVPPWDTWICYADGYLVSWVPPVLEELAAAGIDVNPEQCVQWSSPTFENSLFNSDEQPDRQVLP